MSVGERLKSLGALVLGLLIMAAGAVFIAVFVFGATAASFWIIKWSPWAFWPTLAISIFILAPLALIPPTRAVSAIGFVIASYIFGAIMWFWAVAFTYFIWGFTGVIIGLVILGFGIVPIAMLAAVVHGEWSSFIGLVVLVVLTFGPRALGFWLAEKADERAARLALQRLADVPGQVQ